MRANFTIRRIEYFVAVGEAGSLAEAAQTLNVSPPSISAALAQLESELQTQLFVRQHAQGMALTAGGRRLFAEAKKLLRRAGNLQNIAADLGEEAAGDLRVGCLQTVAPLALPHLRKRFEARFPKVRVQQRESHQAELLQALQNAELDLCLTYDLDIPPGVEFLPLADMPAYVILPAKHPLAGRGALAPADLAPLPFILLNLPLSSKYFLSMFAQTGVAPRIAAKSQDMALVRSMVANGFGYSLGNIHPRPDTAPDGKPLCYAPLKNGLRPMRLGLAKCRADYETRAVAAFCQYCADAVAAGEFPAVAASAAADKKQ